MKNKMITIYELMGLIKDNKAPEKIKYKNRTFTLNKIRDDYEDESYILFLFETFGKSNNTFDFLNTKVEFLPEEKYEWEDIEEIDIENDIPYNPAEKINQLIKNQKCLKERLDKNER